MAYGIKFYMNWKSRTNELLTFNILQKDYSGPATELKGTAKPFTLQKSEENPLAAIQSTGGFAEFYNDASTPLSAFYSEDDEYFRGDLQKRDGTLLWSGYLVQDESEESFQSPPYSIALKFTDNLGFLKDLKFDEAAALTYTDVQTRSGTIVSNVITFTNFSFDPLLAVNDRLIIENTAYLVVSYTWNSTTNTLAVTLLTSPGNGIYDAQIRINGNLLGKHSLFSYLRIALTATGLALPLRIYSNIFETNHNEDTDREMLSQTRLYSGKYLSEAGEWSTIYDIVNDILTAGLFQLFQAGGYWVIIRQTELYRFTNNAVLGVEYDELFENPTAITLSPNFPEISPDNVTAYIGANALKRITRPFKYVKETFNYQQPKQLIKGADLTLLGDFISSSTATIDGIEYRYDRYELPSVWRHLDSDPNGTTDDASYIVVVTDVDKDVVTDRYVYQPFIDHNYKYVQFNPIEVSAGDTIGFSLSTLFQTTDGTDTTDFKVRFLLITPDGKMYNLVNYSPGGGAENYLRWNEVSTNEATTNSTWRIQIGVSITVSQDTTNQQTYNLETITADPNRPAVPSFPYDGILLIGVSGITNPGGAFPNADVSFKDVQLTIVNNINDSQTVIGHTHTQDQSLTSPPKNKYDEEIKIDDAPRNPIAGALFADIISPFAAEIGGIYFTKTSLWNLRGETKNQRLGQFVTNERQMLYKAVRERIEGQFVFSDITLGNANVFFIASLSNLQFIFGNIQEIDFMQMTATGQFWEIHKDDESYVAFDYTFKYLYETK